MHNSEEIVNMKGLFVLNIGYVDMTTYPLTNYYYIIEKVYLTVHIIYQYIFILAVFIYSIMEHRRDYHHASIDILFYIMFYIINEMKEH